MNTIIHHHTSEIRVLIVIWLIISTTHNFLEQYKEGRWKLCEPIYSHECFLLDKTLNDLFIDLMEIFFPFIQQTIDLTQQAIDFFVEPNN
jgi:hypothetical protein